MRIGKIISKFQPLAREILNILFPGFCPVCNIPVSSPQFLCENCTAALPPMPENYCLHCGMATGQPMLGCGSCLLVEDRPDRVYFPFLYQEPLNHLVVRYKFNDHTEWAKHLGELAMERVGHLLVWEDLELVIPVPLHPLRLLWRGYNQAALLAGAMADKLHKPLVTNGLRRVKMTQPQTTLNQQARQTNVRNAFVASQNVVAGRTILMVDDVFTTGSTIWSATQALKKGGAKRVVVCCLTRVVH
ncbi:MAG: ComF family protein [Magnetococcus sp. THC-1_WYH]